MGRDAFIVVAVRARLADIPALVAQLAANSKTRRRDGRHPSDQHGFRCFHGNAVTRISWRG